MARMVSAETALEMVKGSLNIFGCCGCIVENRIEYSYLDSSMVEFTGASVGMNNGMIMNEMRARIYLLKLSHIVHFIEKPKESPSSRGQ